MPKLIHFLFIGLMFSCGEKPPEEERLEGSEPGDCTDGADNDMDGVLSLINVHPVKGYQSRSIS